MLKQRIITAVLLLPILLGALFVPNPLYWQLLMVLVALLGLKEWLNFCQFNKPILRATAYLLLLSLGFVLYAGYVPLLIVVLVSVLLWWCLITVTFFDKPTFLMAPMVKLLIGVWLLASNCWLLTQLKYLPAGYTWILLFFMTIWCADIGAYFVGRRFGKHKLAPSVSPGKTVEGMLGGLAFVVLVLTPILFYFFDASEVVVLLPAIVVTAVLSVAGDLYESKLKRLAGLKDSSQILPGHGGILDRIDSVLSGLPYFSVGLLILSVW